jgi:predicted RNase H-like nuclease (RuvC/YqgF family)
MSRDQLQDAYEYIRDNNLLSQARFRAYEFVYRRCTQGITCTKQDYMDENPEITASVATAKFNELVKMGFLRECGEDGSEYRTTNQKRIKPLKTKQEEIFHLADEADKLQREVDRLTSHLHSVNKKIEELTRLLEAHKKDAAYFKAMYTDPKNW